MKFNELQTELKKYDLHALLSTTQTLLSVAILNNKNQTLLYLSNRVDTDLRTNQKFIYSLIQLQNKINYDECETFYINKNVMNLLIEFQQTPISQRFTDDELNLSLYHDFILNTEFYVANVKNMTTYNDLKMYIHKQNLQLSYNERDIIIKNPFELLLKFIPDMNDNKYYMLKFNRELACVNDFDMTLIIMINNLLNEKIEQINI